MGPKTGKTRVILGAMLLSLCLLVGVAPMTAFADGTGRGAATKAFVKAVFSNAAETAGSDSRICAATVKDKRGDFELHYVYSSDSIWNVQLFNRVRDGLAEPYQSLIPILENDDNHKKGFLFLSDTQYEDLDLDWSDPAAVAEALIPGSGTVTTEENTSSVFSSASTDIIDEYFSDYSEKVVEFINDIGESITPPTGTNIIEAIDSVTKGGPYYIVEDGSTKECYDVVISIHVSQLSAYTVTKTATATNSIDLPVQVLEEDAAEYTPAPELSATFAPDTAVTVREFSGAQGLSIDCCMADIPVSEGYDFQASYTVSIPLWNYQGNTLSGILTVPLPKGYDGATARINGGETAVSYTADTVSFRVTLAISDGTATTEFTIKAAAADNDIQPPKTGDSSHLWLWIAVMLAAGAALTGAVLSSRRRTYD